MKKDNKGFTLIELIVVVLIIAIIAVAMTPQVTKWVKKSRESMDTNNAGTLKTCFDIALTEAMVDSGSVVEEYVVLNSGNNDAIMLRKDGTSAKWYEVAKPDGDATDNEIDTTKNTIEDAFVMADNDKSVIQNISGKKFPRTNLCSAFYVVVKDNGVDVTKLKGYSPVAGGDYTAPDLVVDSSATPAKTAANLYVDGQ